ncbi:MAG: Gfo/Idh/MocA family oxidoreductase [Opitutaceae bacterium]|jgi:predicted dehydrogenase|nr:Gfo/Idh/MocA family oxidoreductase [Opitutaceae bacterium]
MPPAPPLPSRRSFLKRSSAFAVFSILPSGLLANSPNGKLQVAQIGVGGRGKQNLNALLSLSQLDMVGLCDVDSRYLDEAAMSAPGTAKFRDYRQLLEQLDGKIDAVLVSTPDHMHAPISAAVMQQGKHVYCEKPLAHNVTENRELRLLAAAHGVTTQLGIQNSAGFGYRMTAHYVRTGLIGKVHAVHVWSNKEWGRDEAAMPTKTDAIPPHLDWDLWLGVAPQQDYREGFYHPREWRKLIDFGTGTLGDMGVHIFDTPYRTLELTAPNWVRSTCRAPNGFSHPSHNVVEYSFPATRYTAKNLKWTWYDGADAPPTSIEGVTLPEGRQFPVQGCIMVGEKGAILTGHKAGPQTLPPELIRSIPRPKLDPINHHEQWVEACLGNGQTGSPFSYGGPLCEALQLGVVASRFPGEKLQWAPATMKITNLTAANRYLRRNYREF